MNIVTSFLEQGSIDARAAYVQARKEFEQRLTGLESFWGDSPIACWDGGDGSNSPTGRASKPIWPRFVHLAVANEIPITALISARFSFASGARAPEPPDCLSQAAVNAAKRWAQSQGSRLTGRLAADRMAEQTALGRALFPLMEANRIPTDVERQQALWRIATDPAVILTPLYRIHILDRFGRAQIYPKLVAAAVHQYLEDPSLYDQIWQTFVSFAVRQAAAHVRAQLGGG